MLWSILLVCVFCLFCVKCIFYFFFFFQAEDGIRDYKVTGVQTCALPISALQRGDGAAGAHCIHELWMRGEFAHNIEAALAALWSRAAASIPEWLPMR